jgi:hypothetical protein
VAPKSQPAADRLLSLPVQVSSPVDVGRLLRELEQLDEALLQLGLRTGGNSVEAPRTSRLLDQTAQLNNVNLLLPPDRALLRRFLTAVRTKAPVLNMSFSADPTPVFLEKLMTWLRREIHPELLLSVGLQPTIGAGCVVRTTNKYFDFSLRQDFIKKRDLLLAALASPESAA